MPTIAIFAGHGGSDPGAVSGGLREKDLTLSVSNAATAILRGWGYTVINNRTTDVDRSITRDANLANTSGADALVEIHFNSNNGTPGTGSEVFYSIRDTGRGRALASAILNRIVALGFANRGVKTLANASGQDMFGIIRLAQMPAVLVECAFINNPADMARLNINSMAMAIAQGVREVFPIGNTGGGGGGIDGGLPAYPGAAIREGVRGDSVVQIQRCLNRVLACNPQFQPLSEDGIFGPRTLAAVIRFQGEHGLAADGVVGPLTWARLSTECAAGCRGSGIMPPYPGAAIRINARGESVLQIQQCLNRVSARHSSIPRIAEDGAFGPRTFEAVVAFQRMFCLAQDGVVGPLTWSVLTQECGAAAGC